MIWLLVLLWLAGALAVGFPLARSALDKETRLFVLLSFGLVSGHSIQAILLFILWRWMPLGTGIYVAPAISILAGTLLWRSQREQHANGRLSWGLSSFGTVAVLGESLLFAFLVYRVFTTGVYLGWTEGLFQQAGVADWLERGLFPPTNPLEPDDPLHYRIGLHAIAAGLSSGSGAMAAQGVGAILAMMAVLMVLSLGGVSVRLFGRPALGLVASALGLLGQTPYPYLRLLGGLGGGGASLQPDDFYKSPLWAGDSMYMSYVNPTIATGFFAFAAALWLVWETLRQRNLNATSGLAAAVSLAWLGVVNEVYFAALVGGILIAAGLSLLSGLRLRDAKWWRAPLPGAVMLVAAYGIILACGGILGGVAAFGTNPGSLELALNMEHLGSLVHAPPALGPQPDWSPLLDIRTMVDTGFVILVLPLLIAAMWSKPLSYASVGLSASAAVLIAWGAVYPAYNPPDSYRFGQAGMTIYLALAPIALASTSIPRYITPAVLRRLGVAIVVLLTLPSLLFGAAFVFTPPQQRYFLPDSPDAQAAMYLRDSNATFRVLVPTENPAGGWADLYQSSDFRLMAGTLLAASQHAIPMGQHVGPHNPERYVEAYHKASLTFDPSALAALKIDWVYVAPSQLDQDQLRYLQSAKDSGELRLEKSFGDAGTPSERLLLRFTPPQAAQ